MPYPLASPPLHRPRRHTRRLAWAFAALATAGALPMAAAQDPARTAPAAAPDSAASASEPNSRLDGATLFNLILSELETQGGEARQGYERMLALARQTRDEGLFQRAIEMAVQARSPDRALAAAKAWRSAMPESTLALRLQLQLLVALDRPGDLAEPLRTLIEREPAADRAATIAAVPRFLGSVGDKARALAVGEQVLTPYLRQGNTRTAARTALARLALAAGQSDAALAQVERALKDEPAAPGPVMVAMELMAGQPAAEPLVQAYLARPDALTPLRLAYARALEQQQRLGEAATQLRVVLKEDPSQAAGWLSLGAYLVDLRENQAAIDALQNFLRMAPPDGAAGPGSRSSAGARTEPAAASASAPAPAAPPATPREDAAAAGTAGGEAPATAGDGPDAQDLVGLAWQLLAQAYEQQGDDRAAAAWLDRIPPDRVDMAVLLRRASLWSRAGRLAEARALVREAPARDRPDARARVLAEAQVLREARQWAPAYDLLLNAMRQAPDDTTLMYELAMVAERLQRFDDMEALLRRVIAVKPEDQHAHNALGYSLAERNVRLDEAEALVQKAASMAPHDPFIQDSLGWVAYRRGRHDDALRLLQRSHVGRPHVEVAAHLGEVLWVTGRQDEALRVWRDGQRRESDNEVLRDTLARLQVKL